MTEDNQADTTNQDQELVQTTIGLGLSDLALMANIIQVTSERGAVKANEMQVVGALYTKLVSFVNANTPAAATEANEEDQTDAENDVDLGTDTEEE